MTRLAALAGVVSAALVALVALAGSALAHPLGNFTANTSAAITVRPDAIAVDYVVDLAEIPALRVVQDLDSDGDGAVSESEGAGYRVDECDRLAEGIELAVDGATVDPAVTTTSLELPPGQGGLVTLRLECRMEAESPAAGERTVTFADANLDGRIGWREVTAVGDGTTLTSSDVPTASPSDRLRTYPEDQLSSPLDIRSATLAVEDGGGAAGLVDAVGPGGAAGSVLDRATDAFTGLVARPDLTVVTALGAVLVAVGLGALHGVAPGHGKTVMAAYLVSKEGTARQALGLALTVAVTHTVGVLVLGAVLTVAEVAAPQQLYGWLGLVSGLLFAAVGLGLLRSALAARRRGESHHHHHHAHDDHEHQADREPALAAASAAGERAGAAHAVRSEVASDAERPQRDHPAPRSRAGTGVSWRSLAAPGLAGGMVPTPSALVVLLGGIALDRTWFGVALVGAYGVGMAGVLVGAGMLLLRARGGLESRVRTGRLGRLAGALPIVTACLVLSAGLVIAARAASTI